MFPGGNKPRETRISPWRPGTDSSRAAVLDYLAVRVAAALPTHRRPRVRLTSPSTNTVVSDWKWRRPSCHSSTCTEHVSTAPNWEVAIAQVAWHFPK